MLHAGLRPVKAGLRPLKAGLPPFKAEAACASRSIILFLFSSLALKCPSFSHLADTRGALRPVASRVCTKSVIKTKKKREGKRNRKARPGEQLVHLSHGHSAQRLDDQQVGILA